MKSKKGILLTLLTIVLFVLMLGELVAYTVLNINYEQLASSSAASSDLGLFLASINNGAGVFLINSLGNAMGSLAVYEGTPTMRTYHFVNNSAFALQSLMNNGTIYGTNMSGYMGGATLNSYLASIAKAGGAQGVSSISITNATITVYQTQPFYVSAALSALAVINSSYGSVAYPVSAIVNVSINGTPDIASAEHGNPHLLKVTYASPNAALVGNVTAQYGSRSPFMFAYGTIIYIGGTPTCNSVPSQYRGSGYILATPNAQDIGQSVCGMSGLVANVVNSSVPLKPYLSYSGTSIFSSIQNGTQLLLNGANLSLMNVYPLQQAIRDGYSFRSVSAPAYLDSVQGSISRGSQSGIFSFNLFNRETASFNGATSNILTNTALSANSFTITFWVDGASTSKMTSASGYTVFSSAGTKNIDFWLSGGGPLGANPGSGDEKLGIGSNTYASYGVNGNSWNFVAISVNSGVAELYSDQQSNYTIKVLPGPYSLGSLDLGGPAGGIGALDGNLTNFQVYSTALQPSQIAHIYLNGINGQPITNASLYAWYPLNGNANDYSGSAHNGTQYSMQYAFLSGYTGDPLFQNLPNRLNTSAVKGVLNCGNLNQCMNSSLSHLDLGPRLLGTTGGESSNETASLGLQNGDLPNGLSFEFGSSTYMETANGYSAPTALTVSEWIYPAAPSGTGGQNPFWSIPASTWGLGYTAAGEIHFFCGSGTSVDLTNSITYGSWQNLVMVCQNSGSSTLYTVYLNGSLVASGSISGNIKPVNSIIFGNYSATSSFYGILSDVHVYGAALSGPQVEQLYLNDSVNGVAPLGWWPMSTSYQGLMNQTQDVVGGNLARAFGCPQYTAVYGDCPYFTQT